MDDTLVAEKPIPAAPIEPLDWRISVIVVLILAMLTVLFLLGLIVQWQGYQSGIRAALDEPVKDHAAILSYERALDAAIVKTSALFLGYLLVFTGALYVLRSTRVNYRVGIQSQQYAGTLETSSPGLVIITLGVLLIAVTILTKSDINYQGPSSTPSVEEETQGPDWQPVESEPSVPTTVPPSERNK